MANNKKVVNKHEQKKNKNGVNKKLIIILLIIAVVLLAGIVTTVSIVSSSNNEKKDKKAEVKKDNDKKVPEIEEEETVEIVVPPISVVNEPVVKPVVKPVATQTVAESAKEEDKEEIDEIAPTVTGVEEGTIVSSVNINAIDAVTDTENLIATIDGAPYTLETDYNVNGEHVLVVRDEAGNETIVNFTIAIMASETETIENILAASNENDIIYVNKTITANTPIIIDKSLTIKGDGVSEINANINVIGNANITLDGVNIKSINKSGNNHIMNVNTTGSFKMINSTFDVNNNESRVGIYIENAESVSITDSIFMGTAVKHNLNNLIEFSGDISVKNGTTISNNRFMASAGTNNLISMYNFDNNATITLDNNYFEKSGNAIRIANRNNATGVNININNNKYDATDDRTIAGEECAYAGLLLIQPWDSAEDFTGITININNVINNSVSTQLLYAYNTTQILLPTVNVDGNPVAVIIRK